jgi:type VI protein secretion system component Hcp
MVKVRIRTLLAGAVALVAATIGVTNTGGSTHAQKSPLITTLHDAVLAANAFEENTRFLSVTGFTGGYTTDEAHPGLVNVDNLQVGLSSSYSTGAGGGTTVGKSTLDRVLLSKDLDVYSPQLLKAAAQGLHIPNVTVFVRRAGDKPYDIATFSLTNVIVVHDVMDAKGNESVALIPLQLCVTYKLQNPNGSLQDVKTCYNQAANKVS